MGISYNGVYFYGLLYDQYSDDDEPEGWPSAARLVLADGDEESDRDLDFDRWLREYLGVPDYEWRENAHEEMRRLSLERAAKLKARCLEVFGVEGFDSGWMGLLDYSMNYICPKGAVLREWRGAKVPEWPPEQVEVWRTACEKLRAALPGAGEPGLWFGCQVG